MSVVLAHFERAEDEVAKLRQWSFVAPGSERAAGRPPGAAGFGEAAERVNEVRPGRQQPAQERAADATETDDHEADPAAIHRPPPPAKRPPNGLQQPCHCQCGPAGVERASLFRLLEEAAMAEKKERRKTH